MARVLIAGFCALPGPDRAGVQLSHVLRELGRHHVVDLLCVRRADQAYVERRGPARILRVPVSDQDPLARAETFRRALRRQLEGADYDVVLVRDSWSGVPVLEMREALRCALVFDAARSPMGDAASAPSPFAEQMARDEDTCLRHADLVLAPTEAARQYLATRAKPDRVHQVPLGVDIDLFDWDEAPKGTPPSILYVGPVSEAKGVGVLVRAMELVAERSDARLVLAGAVEPDDAERLGKEIADLGLEDRIVFAGELEHRRVPELIAQATVCVAPEAPELTPRPTAVFPTKILEYMACRRAVVAPRRGTVTLLMRDRQHGMLFNPGDSDSLGMQLIRLIGNPELRETVAQAGYDLVRRAHTASATRRSLRHVFAWLSVRGPWAERWHRDDSAEPELVPMGGSAEAGVTDSIAFQDVHLAAGADSIPFTADQTLYDDDGLEPDEDHTMVEAPSERRVLQFDTAEERSLGRGDDWVVSEGPQRLTRASFGGSDAMQGRLVAGEVEINAGPSEPVEPAFEAMSPLLGGTPSQRSAPPPMPAKSSGPVRSAPPPMPAKSGGPAGAAQVETQKLGSKGGATKEKANDPD